MARNKEEILRVENLKHYFVSGHGKNRIEVKAVDDISFSINKGEVFSLVGESGCGKTTTGRAIIKLYNATGGNVFFHGQRIIADVTKAKEVYKQELAVLKERLQNQEITDEEFKQQKAEKLAVYKQAKYDKKFEKIVTPGMRREAKNITPDHPSVIESTNNYLAEIEETKTKIIALNNEKSELTQRLASDKKNSDLKKELSDLVKAIKNHKKRIQLNKMRINKATQMQRKLIMNRNRDLMRRMQMIFQDPIASLNPRMTVKEIVAEGLRINGEKDEVEIDRRVKEALNIVGLLPEHAGRYPHEFSGGQRQRIGIARALVSEPSFIIADEPISALDVSIRAQVINLLNDLRENFGVTIMFIAHDLSVVKYFSDRVAVMYYGKIVEFGKKELIFENTLHPYTLSLIDSIPHPDPIYEQKRGAIMRYYPSQVHDYSLEAPTLKEVEPDHFVLCDTKEFEKYKAIVEANRK